MCFGACCGAVFVGISIHSVQHMLASGTRTASSAGLLLLMVCETGCVLGSLYQACMLLPVSVWPCRTVYGVKGRMTWGKGFMRVLTGIDIGTSGRGATRILTGVGPFALSVGSPKRCLLKCMEASREYPSRCSCGMREAFGTGVMGAAGHRTDVHMRQVLGPRAGLHAVARGGDVKQDNVCVTQGILFCWPGMHAWWVLACVVRREQCFCQGPFG